MKLGLIKIKSLRCKINAIKDEGTSTFVLTRNALLSFPSISVEIYVLQALEHCLFVTTVGANEIVKTNINGKKTIIRWAMARFLLWIFRRQKRTVLWLNHDRCRLYILNGLQGEPASYKWSEIKSSHRFIISPKSRVHTPKPHSLNQMQIKSIESQWGFTLTNEWQAFTDGTHPKLQYEVSLSISGRFFKTTENITFRDPKLFTGGNRYQNKPFKRKPSLAHRKC